MYLVFNRCSPCSQPWDECQSFGHAAELARTLTRLYQSPSYVFRASPGLPVMEVVLIAEAPKGRRTYVTAQQRLAAWDRAYTAYAA